MMRLLRLSFVARIAIIFIFSLVSIQFLAVMGYFIQRSSNTNTGFRLPLPDQVAAIVSLIESAPEDRHPAILRAVNSTQVSAYISENFPAPPIETWRSAPFIESRLKKYLAVLEDRQVTVLVEREEAGLSRLMPLQAPAKGTVIVSLKDGRNLVIEVGGPLALTFFGFPPGFWAGVFGFAVALIAIIIIRREARPLRQLARAADRLNLSEPRPIPDFPGSAPEIRAVISAFNRMQERILSLIKARMAMIGGFSHDVRTYATRLRLRAELIPDEAERARAIRDIEDMISLLDDALFAVQDRPCPDNSELVDLAALLQEEIEEKRARGLPAAIRPAGGDAPFLVLGNPVALRRLFANLIENAIAYGGEARVSLSAAQDVVEVAVEDRGPGISMEMRNAVTQPFVRLEQSRNRKTGGAGLGLAIAKRVAEGHGGGLVIGDAEGGGARVSVSLPLFDASRDNAAT